MRSLVGNWKVALADLPAAVFFESPLVRALATQAKPNSKFSGIQIGVITYSYGRMPDQSAEATLKYVLVGRHAEEHAVEPI